MMTDYLRINSLKFDNTVFSFIDINLLNLLFRTSPNYDNRIADNKFLDIVIRTLIISGEVRGGGVAFSLVRSRGKMAPDF